MLWFWVVRVTEVDGVFGFGTLTFATFASYHSFEGYSVPSGAVYVAIVCFLVNYV
jgi:hypothetical protein